MSFATINENPIDRMGVKGPLKFNKNSFNLAWSDKPNDFYYIQEYLPKGENVEHFNQMLTIHLFDKDIKIADAVGQKINELKERKKTDATCNYEVNESPDGKEFMVDFVVSETKGEEITIAEFNIYRFKEINLGSKKGILVYTYTRRSYGEKTTEFFTNLGADRMESLNAMISSEMPTIKLANK